MVEYIALGLVLLKYGLDYVKGKTKTKVDDKISDIVNQLPLPTLHDAAHAVADKQKKPEAAVRGFTPHEGPRDHRTK